MCFIITVGCHRLPTYRDCIQYPDLPISKLRTDRLTEKVPSSNRKRRLHRLLQSIASCTPAFIREENASQGLQKTSSYGLCSLDLNLLQITDTFIMAGKFCNDSSS
ncbi:hypothetical protein P7K49_001085 [Saguinus oedipus]|uniref:Uncharacterized protein n=1 Tax=Saguinus oedipus TaxID=9490 RepID=A0ABQ9WDH2_SAGOE|nr:hypothetical protein P7K49_001085 [Saguinus oedipus]